jgi:hypothetical protein
MGTHGAGERLSSIPNVPNVPRRRQMKGNLLTRPALLQRLEGAVALAAALALYHDINANWLLFAALLLAPDVSAVGYVFGSAVGAATYNLVHTYVLPAALATYGQLAGNPLAITLALIWFAHIGLDRLLGFGLKYSDGFGHTHLGQLGRRPT